VQVGVALEVEETRGGEGLDLRPREQRSPRREGDASRDEEDHGLHPVLAEQGHGHAAHRAAAVVEGQDDGPVGGESLAAQDGEVLVGREGGVAVAGEVLHLALERGDLGLVEDEHGHVAAGQVPAGHERG